MAARSPIHVFVRFLEAAQWFGRVPTKPYGGKDLMNAETIELLCVTLIWKILSFCKSASQAAEVCAIL